MLTRQCPFPYGLLQAQSQTSAQASFGLSSNMPKIVHHRNKAPSFAFTCALLRIQVLHCAIKARLMLVDEICASQLDLCNMHLACIYLPQAHILPGNKLAWQRAGLATSWSACEFGANMYDTDVRLLCTNTSSMSAKLASI